MDNSLKIKVIPLINSWKDKYMFNNDLLVRDRDFLNSLITNDIPSNLAKDDINGLDKFISNWINHVGYSNLCQQYVLFLRNISTN